MFTRRVRTPIAAAMAAGCIGLVLANAVGAVDLRDWGRKFPTSQRFVVLSQFDNEAVLDKETQLVWQRTPTSNLATWQGARSQCGRLAIAGRRGWRLPSLHELTSLTRPEAPVGALALPSGHPFVNVQIAAYWTDTLWVIPGSLPTSAYTVHFNSSGLLGIANAGFFHGFWCVRGGGEF